MNDRLPQLQKQIIDFGNSAEFKELDAYYSQPSIFSALGVSRHENTHSNFIAWLLDPSSNHGLGDMPLRKFLEAFSLACALPHSRGKIPQDLISAITAGDYKLSAVTVEREKVLKDGSRVDIYLEGIIAFDRKEYPLKLAIENKVKSSEHDSQTKRYLEALRPPVSSPDIFLTPLSNRKYELLGAPECDSKDFIQLNYQYLADYIIEPCRDCLEEGGVKRYLTEYLLALGLPETRQTKGDFIMAISKEERALLARFWDKHKDLLTAVILSINEYVPLDDEESEVVAEAAKALEAAAQRNLTRYSWEHYTGGYSKSAQIPSCA
ncbi:MAG: PD-(D/E)XK nuclease family protein [Ruminococcus sp.]|nr:PD-(D/E)XK nuclease family protein [Ruminococcus sp.]